MAINKKLIHFQSKKTFLNEYNNGNILPSSIVFIRDAKQIWTHDEFYSCPFTEDEINQLIAGNKIKLDGYIEIDSPIEISATDTVNEAFGKIEDYLNSFSELNAILVDTGKIEGNRAIQDIKNQDTGQVIYPKTHIKAVVVDEGTTLEQLIGSNVDDRLGALESVITTKGEGNLYLSDDGTYKEVVTDLSEYQKIVDADAKYSTIANVTNIDNRLETVEANYINKSTAATKAELANKQNIIEDLDIIREGAALGKTSVQDISHLATKDELTSGLATKQNTISDLNSIRSGAQKGETALQANDITHLASKTEVAAKQNIIEDLDVIRAGAAKGATALQQHQDISHLASKTEVNTELNKKVDKVNGKQLSTEDFTSALKAKLEGLSNYNDTAVNQAIENLQTQINTLVNADSTAAINTFNEIISFLEGIENTEDLESIIAGIESQISNINNNLSKYLLKTDASNTYLSKSEASMNYQPVGNYITSIPTADGTTAGIVKEGGDVTIQDGIITINDDSHNHIISNIDGLQTALDSKVPTTRTINGKALSSNITLTAANVGADASGSASAAEANANSYTDTKVSKLAESVTANQESIESLINTKVDKVTGKGLSTNDYTTAEKNKLSGIASGAEVNQNAFSNIIIGDTTISANSKTDTLTLSEGSNITITPDNDTITITAKDTTYSDATQSVAGLMSANDKKKLDGIAEGANKYSLPNASSSTKGGVKIGSNITVSSGTISLTKDNVTNALGYVPPTAYNSATEETAGLMSAEDKAKLDGITASADSVSFTQSLTSGTEVGTININGSNTKLYAPTNTNTTYVFTGGTNKFTVTPSGGTAQDVTVIPSISNNVTYSGTLTSGQVAIYDGTAGTIKASGKTLGTSVPESAVFTDTKVTSVGNHYSPTANTNSTLSADASSTTAATWGSTSLVTGVNLERDAAGHVTGVSVDSIKMPANPNSDTTYTFANGTNQFTVTPLGGSAQTVKVTPSATITATATDDDVVVLTGTNGTNKVAFDAKHAKKGPSSGYTSGNTTTSISGSGASGTIKVPQITVDEYGHVTAATDESVTITMPTNPTLSGLGGVGSVSASGTAPLTLTASKSGTDVTITGSVATMGAASSSASGSAGLVPAPAAGKQAQFLRGDGTWATPTNTTYTAMTASEATTGTGTTARSITAKVLHDKINEMLPDAVTTTEGDTGLMTAADKVKLNGIEAGANKYTHPTYTARTGKPTSNATPAFGGTFTVSQVTSDSTGHVTGMTDRTITIPATEASTSAKGLMTSAMVTKLNSLSNYDDTAVKASVSSLQTQLNTLVSGNASTAIESFNEITAFLEGVEDTETLDGIIAGINTEIAKKADKGSAITNITRSGTTFTATRADGTTFTFTQQDNNTKVTSVSNHYTPSGGSAKATTAGSAVSFGGAVVTGVTVDAAGHITGVTTGTIPSNPNTDTKVTAVGNHYTPTGGSAATLTAGGSTLSFGGAVVTGVTLDAAKHVTGITTSKLPANPNTDTKVTAVGNHYSPSENADYAITALGGTAKDITNNSSTGQLNVVTGLKRDAAGHVVGVTCSNIYSKNTTYSAGTGLSLSGTTFSANGSAIINSLGEGTSPAQRTDYIVAQYAGGGTTTTTYHRRSVANLFAALNKSDITTALGYTPPTTNTTYSAVTQSAAGLMSAADKIKLDGIASGATANTGTVTKVSTGTGLTGGDIITTGTVSLKSAATGEIGGIKVKSVATTAQTITDQTTGNSFPVRLNTDNLAYVTIPAYTNNSGDITGVTAGNGLTGGATSGTATLNVGAGTGISVSADTVDLKTAATSEIGGIKVRKDTTGYAVTAATSGTISADVTSGKYYGVEIDKNDAAFVYVPWTDTNTKVTSAANHYTPAEDTSAAITASGGSATNITGTTGVLNVVTGLKRDAKGHIVGVTSANIYSTDADTHYTTAIRAGASGTNSNAAVSNPYVKVLDNTTYRSQIQLKGGGATTVSSDANGVITISSTTYESKAAASGGTATSLVTTGEKYTWNNKGTYSKPSGGIPASDLATAVQTSLSKADTALQSYTEQYTGTITGVSANGTSIATSGVANIPAASTSKYGVTKLSSSTSSTSTSLAATASAVKAAYDLAASKGTGTITGITMNGSSKGTSGVVDLGNVVTDIKLVDTDTTISNPNIKYLTVSQQSLNDVEKTQVRENLGINLNNFAEKIKMVNCGTSNTTISIEPNTLYKWGEVQTLSISLTTPEDNSIVNEYMFEFVSGSTATTLSLPDTIQWVSTPSVEANTTYQCSIMNNVGIIVSSYNL